MQYYNAQPFYQRTLDAQIKSLGGDGFNTKVTSERVDNSFRFKYTFATPRGPKCLVSRNEVSFATVPGFGIGLYNASTRCFSFLPHDSNQPEQILGRTINRAKKALFEMFPNHLNITFEQLDEIAKVSPEAAS